MEKTTFCEDYMSSLFLQCLSCNIVIPDEEFENLNIEGRAMHFAICRI